MKIKSLPSLVPVLAMALALAANTGCHSTHDHGPYAPQSTKATSLESTAKFVLLDEAAQYSITCTGLQERQLPDGRLEIAANIKNRENRRLQVQINCVFKDDQGFSIHETPFETLILTENATETVRFTNLNDKSNSYTIRVRQAR